MQHRSAPISTLHNMALPGPQYRPGAGGGEEEDDGIAIQESDWALQHKKSTGWQCKTIAES